MKEFLNLAEERYSVRKFTDEQIREEDLAKIIAAANLAPTAHNYQPQKVYVVQSQEGLEKLQQLTHCTYGARTILIIGYDKEKEWKSPIEPGYRSGVQDASIVATHIMLEAWDLGIGSCWVDYFKVKDTAAAFELPDNIEPVLLMPIGYPAPDSKPGPMHKAYPEQNSFVEII